MNRKHQKSWGMAYCGIVTALCVALMLLGAVIPIAMFIAPAVRTLYIGISGGLSERDSIALNRELSPGSTE